jgi:hypothetical protein
MVMAGLLMDQVLRRLSQALGIDNHLELNTFLEAVHDMTREQLERLDERRPIYSFGDGNVHAHRRPSPMPVTGSQSSAVTAG